MMNTRKIELTLEKMAELLRFGLRVDWANALEQFQGEIGKAQNATAARILSMYGGMGSLNDLVLYKSGQPLAEENI